jgi:hypothetical protein
LRDLSQLGAVVPPQPSWLALVPGEAIPGTLWLERKSFPVTLRREGRVGSDDGAGVALVFEALPPSARAQLKFFLSPKRIGESMALAERGAKWRYAAGLNGAGLWLDVAGDEAIFAILDSSNERSQLLVWLVDRHSPVRLGLVSRARYEERVAQVVGGKDSAEAERLSAGEALGLVDKELPVLPLNDRDTVLRLSECRDVLTNFRPADGEQGALKMRLLKGISESLYSASNRMRGSEKRPASPLR